MYVFKVEGMNCMSCVRNIDEALKDLDASLAPQVDFKAKTVSLETTIDKDIIAKTIVEAGYEVKSVSVP